MSVTLAPIIHTVTVQAGPSVTVSEQPNTVEIGGASVAVTRTTNSVTVTTPSQTVAVTSPTVQVVTAGTQGPQGPAGPGDANYVHTQNSASTTWDVTHNLNKFPAVAVVDSAGTWVQGDLTYLDENTLRLGFTAAFSGKAYMN